MHWADISQKGSGKENISLKLRGKDKASDHSPLAVMEDLGNCIRDRFRSQLNVKLSMAVTNENWKKGKRAFSLQLIESMPIWNDINIQKCYKKKQYDLCHTLY